MSSFGPIETALSALIAHQAGLQVVSHNTANAATSGYHRKDVLLQPLPAWPGPTGEPVFQGVGIAEVRRAQDDYLDVRARLLTGQQGHWRAMESALAEVEGLLAVSEDADIAALMEEFWTSWQSLSAQPESTTARIDVLQRGAALASGFRSAWGGLTDAIARNADSLASQVSQVNALAADIARLNALVRTAEQPADLLDRRDALLAQLADLSGALATAEGDMVLLGDRPLVQGEQSYQVELSAGRIKWAADGAQVGAIGGQIGGAMSANARIASYRDALDALSAALITEVNSVHRSGYGLDNSHDLDFFAGAGARDMDISSAVAAQPSRLAAASAPDAPGDGSMALEIAHLRDSSMASGQTPGMAWAALIAEVAQQRRAAIDNRETSGQALEQVSYVQQSSYGVSTDEELIHLAELQHAYEAAARVIQSADEMLQAVLAMGA